MDVKLINLEGVSQMLQKINSSVTEELTKGYEESGEILKNAAITKLQSVTPAANKPNDVYGTTPIQNIRNTLWSKGGGTTVSILGKGSKSTGYILRWFEGGTQERQTKEGANRGKMTATHFFSNAASENESRIIAHLKDTINKAIDKAQH